MTSPKIIAVIPAYNEEKTVGSVVRGLKPHVSEIILVDDHSSDKTAEAARAAGAVVIRQEKNLGYDASLNAGFKAAALRGADIFITLDADGEHDVRDVPRVLAPILSGTADISLGQRPRARHIAESIFSLYTRVHWGVPDALCGLKAYSRKVYDSVVHFDSVTSIGTELMIRGITRGFRFSLVPITLHSRAYDNSRFYAFNVRGNLRILRAMIRVLFM